MPVVSTRVKDFYAVLGITKNATEEDIKTAFKALALRWHPDRHPKGKEDAARKFIEINEAYRFLMDKRRRAWYDNFPETKRGRASSTKNDDVPTTTRARAKSETDMKTRAPTIPEKTAFFESTPNNAPHTTEQQLDVSRPVYAFESWAQFVAKAATFIPSSTRSKQTPSDPPHEAMKDESGVLSTGSTSPSNVLRSSFASPSTLPRTSSSSATSGPKSKLQSRDGSPDLSLKSRNAIIYDDSDDNSSPKKLGVQLKTITDATAGAPSEWEFPLPLTLEELHEGTSHRYRITRSLLSGERKNVMVDIEVAPGWKEGTKIRFPGAGNERRNNKLQDIVFVVQEIPHSRYKRNGSTLIANIQIPLEDALVGNLFISLPGLDGKKIEITTPPGLIKPGDQYIIRDSGMPIRRQGKFIGKGDMIIRLQLECPEKLSSEQTIKRS